MTGTPSLTDAFLEDLRQEFLKDDGFFDDSREILSQMAIDPLGTCQSLLKRTHGFKADAQAVGFAELGTQVAQFEDLVEEVLRGLQSPSTSEHSGDDELKLSEALQAIQLHFDTLKGMGPRGPLTQSPEDLVPFDSSGGDTPATEDLLSGVTLTDSEPPKPVATEEEPAAAKRYLLCLLGEKHYAVPIEQVHEVLEERPINPLPLPTRNILGVVNLRGRVLPLINLPHMLGEEASANAQGGVIVVSGEGLSQFGVMVQAASTVVEIAPRDMTPLDSTPESSAAVTAIVDLNHSSVLCLDLTRISL